MERKSTKFSKEDDQNLVSYIDSTSKQFGNLHERMKWLIGCKEELREYVEASEERELIILFQRLAFAVKDLETEVSYSRTANIPFGERSRPRDHPLSRVHYEHRKNGE